MWKVKVVITLSSNDNTNENKEIQVQIEESIPNGFQNMDKWEADVRKIGFRAMRELFKNGIKLFEDKILSSYKHKDKRCKLIRKGKQEFSIATLFGKVRFPRQRVLCKRCKKWLLPINEAIGLHDDDKERATIGFKELASLCSANQPYRQATQMVKQITYDQEIVSHEQVRLIVQTEGEKVRQAEEEDRKDAVFCFIKSLQNNPYSRRKGYSGRFYICLDGTFVRSTAGKNCFREGKVGFICTDRRESAGNRLRIPIKRYVSSFDDSYVLGCRIRGQALRLALRVYREIFVIGDGARWVRKILEQCFPEAIYILDWYHLNEKLYTALKLTLPDDNHRKDIYRVLSSHLWRGLKDNALLALKSLYSQMLSDGKQAFLNQPEGLSELISYIESNWEGIVDYRQMSQSGYMVSSSLVEKAVDLVIAKRLKKSQGMHWSQSGADNVCALRTLWLNEDWGNYWWERREHAA